MKKTKLFAACMMAAMTSLSASAQHQFTVQAGKPGVEIQPTMYGIFFEDINFGADGGLYAEMVENRSFEFPQRLMGWQTFGNVTVSDVKPAFDQNPHYVTIEASGAREKQSGLENRGFFGMGLKKDMKYDFSVYARLHLVNGKETKFRVELVGSDNVPIARDTITVTNNKWQKYTATLTSTKTDPKGLIRIFLMSGESVDMDHISLFLKTTGMVCVPTSYRISPTSSPVCSVSPAVVSWRVPTSLPVMSGRSRWVLPRTVL